MLAASQRQVIQYIEAYSKKLQKDAKQTINHVLAMSNISTEVFEQAVNNMKKNARIGIHFHPDRLTHNRISVAESLYNEGVYKSQFETFISNGSVSAYKGGERDLWETRMFGGAYQYKGISHKERPKYGALNIMLYSDGPAPRFGSCYFLLSPSISYRSTYTYMDSHLELKEKGTYQEFDLILAALLEDSFSREIVLGESDIRPPKLISFLANLYDTQSDLVKRKPSRNLDYYIEAQVHGDVSLEKDVDALVADDSFQATEIGTMLAQLCGKYSIRLYWRKGFKLNSKDVPSDFRGAKMPLLAKRITHCDYINASVIGSAAKDLYFYPENWSDYGTVNEVLQEFKLLWHVLVRYG